ARRVSGQPSRRRAWRIVSCTVQESGCCRTSAHLQGGIGYCVRKKDVAICIKSARCGSYTLRSHGWGMEIKNSPGQLILTDEALSPWQAVTFFGVVLALTAIVVLRTENLSYPALFMAAIACYLLYLPTRTAVFDTLAQELRLETRWIVLSQSRTIPFREIAAIGLETKTWNNQDQSTPNYRIRARLRSGQIVKLTNWSGRTGG